MKTHALRLRPGQDLKAELDKLAQCEGWEAACVLACVGSLTQAAIRYANCPEATKRTGPFEIVSLSGTLSKHGSHLHIAISDAQGTTLGGHLKEGSLVYTTVEIILGILPGVSFQRRVDPSTGWSELHIEPENSFSSDQDGQML